MLKKKGSAIIFVVFLIIGIIHGSISISLNIFLTWIFIGLWIIFTIKIFENIKQHREFNSPHNTAFFVIIPLFIGIFYSIWGYFTGILGENLLNGSNLYFSWWSLIFGFPFIIYGCYSLYRCFKKYNVIYFGTKSVKAKTLGYILTSTVILFIIIYWVMFYAVIEFYNSPITPLHFSLNLNLLLLFIASLLIFIIYGLASSHRSLPALTRDYITQRTRRINSLSTPTIQRQRVHTTTRTNPSPSRRTGTQTTTSRSHSSRTTPTSHRQKTKTTKTTRSRAVKTTSKAINLARFKPRASYLSEDDFKCIFCFKLPKLPDDNGRGIIVCPSCRYPAHADEFKDWLRTSNLCSRCSAPIPSKFKQNPRIISIRNYEIIYRHFLKKKR